MGPKRINSDQFKIQHARLYMSNDNNSLLINFGLFKGRFFALHRPLSISFEISFTAVFKGHAKQASQPFILESVNFNEDQNVSKTSRFKFLIHSCLNYNRFDPERQHKCFVEKIQQRDRTYLMEGTNRLTANRNQQCISGKSY